MTDSAIKGHFKRAERDYFPFTSLPLGTAISKYQKCDHEGKCLQTNGNYKDLSKTTPSFYTLQKQQCLNLQMYFNMEVIL